MTLLMSLALLLLFTIAGSVAAQERLASPDAKAAKEHLELARQYRVWDDPRAGVEYKQAISALKGVYPVAWKELSFFLARRLRFSEATNALQTAMKQAPHIRGAENFRRLDALRRASRLKSRNEKEEVLSLDELLDLVNLVDRFGVKGMQSPMGKE